MHKKRKKMIAKRNVPTVEENSIQKLLKDIFRFAKMYSQTSEMLVLETHQVHPPKSRWLQQRLCHKQSQKSTKVLNRLPYLAPIAAEISINLQHRDIFRYR